ncbi:hypothetical protein SAMN05421786_101274 [Chryseobacterium ureilyticum]|uniref:Uncharacterized protein n=1 Tax=Chryseobacterium ureilyticum TaxID=373668 RepID=A0A1N7K6S3_9FLAO|nr:hypothetical protein [Chryseobacterium ureilyticum]SIS57270.1 hypothetical protein SAMN05421786_101274 [Chryseobacterium ureilyticum]
MDIKPIIVREYLESLTESDELDSLFPILLESKGFTILSKPKEYKGFPQYGKDVVAVGKDEDGILKRFYFEIKGGEDRDVTTTTFHKKDGIVESLREAKHREFITSRKNFYNLPLKLVLVHNGEMKANISETFDGFIKQEFPEGGNIEFERWGISELTKLFSEDLFGVNLLTNKKNTKLFNKVLINLNVNDDIQNDFELLVNALLFDEVWKGYKTVIPRKWKLIFQSLKLISFIIYTESKEYNNLEIAKKYISFVVIRFWFWILKNKLENDKKILFYYNQIFLFYYDLLDEYFFRTLPIAKLKDGLFCETGGRYEQIGYTVRTFDYIFYLTHYLKLSILFNPNFDKNIARNILAEILRVNNVSVRPLIDIHSQTIISVLNFFIALNDIESAKKYLIEVCGYITLRHRDYKILPDANNSIASVIKFTESRVKPIYYSDSTSPLLNVIMEYLVILGIEDRFSIMKKFINDNQIDLGLFVPHLNKHSKSLHLIEEKELDLDEQLFSKSVNDGYQSDLKISKVDYENFELNADINFQEFKEKLLKRKDEFEYEYRTDKAGYSFLRDLAHFHYKTPYFPDMWRVMLFEESE